MNGEGRESESPGTDNADTWPCSTNFSFSNTLRALCTYSYSLGTLELPPVNTFCNPWQKTARRREENTGKSLLKLRKATSMRSLASSQPDFMHSNLTHRWAQGITRLPLTWCLSMRKLAGFLLGWPSEIPALWAGDSNKYSQCRNRRKQRGCCIPCLYNRYLAYTIPCRPKWEFMQPFYYFQTSRYMKLVMDLAFILKQMGSTTKAATI